MQSNFLILLARMMASFSTFFSTLQNALPIRAPNRSARLAFRCGLLALPMFATGCGGGSGAANNATQRQTGRLQVVVKWPDYQPSIGASEGSAASKQAGASGGRFIPTNATRIVVTVGNSDTPGGPQSFTVTRDQPAHTFTLPVGTFPVQVREYEASGQLVAQADDTIPIQADKDMPLTIKPDTTVNQVQITVAPITFNVGANSSIMVAPYSNDNPPALVPVPASALSFRVIDVTGASVAGVSANGILTGLHAGTATVTATVSFPDDLIITPAYPNGKPFSMDSNSANFTVQTQINITSPPPSVAFQTGGTYSNTANLTAAVANMGDYNNGVVWRIVDGNGNMYSSNTGGTIVSTGLYTATYTAPSVSTNTTADTRSFYIIASPAIPNPNVLPSVPMQVIVHKGNVNVNVN